MPLSRRKFLSASIKLAVLLEASTALAITEEAIKKNKDGKAFRDFANAPEHVHKFYKEHHAKQTYAFAKQKRDHYQRLQQGQETLWGMLERLDAVVDDSDPDISLSQMEHAYQTAEAMRRDGLPEWLQLVGFIHDTGKALIFWGEPQWAVVGDTFPTGLRYSENIILYDYLQTNPDFNDTRFNTDFGIYKPGIGLNEVIMSWGHDEYLYQVLKQQSNLPEEALFVIRYHSLYPLHAQKDARYSRLMTTKEKQMMKWVEIFNRYDLYSKSGQSCKEDKALEQHYKKMVSQYIPGTLNW